MKELKTNYQILYECIRLLIRQVKEEQTTRKAVLQALAREEAPLEVTDEEVNARILELQEVLRNRVKKP